MKKLKLSVTELKVKAFVTTLEGVEERKTYHLRGGSPGSNTNSEDMCECIPPGDQPIQ